MEKKKETIVGFWWRGRRKKKWGVCVAHLSSMRVMTMLRDVFMQRTHTHVQENGKQKKMMNLVDQKKRIEQKERNRKTEQDRQRKV